MLSTLEPEPFTTKSLWHCDTPSKQYPSVIQSGCVSYLPLAAAFALHLQAAGSQNSS